MNAKAMAAALPNIAAFHQRGPQRVATTVTTIRNVALPPTTIQPRLVGTSSPPPGAAKKRKPERPKAMAATPTHSRTEMEKRKYVPRIATRNSSSMVRIGWTTESRPMCSAKDCRRKEQIMKPKPRIQTPRRMAWAIRLSRMVDSLGASSTPMRWNTLVSALDNAAATART